LNIIILVFKQEAEKLKKLFEQARGKIDQKVGEVNNATERVKIFKKKAEELQKNLANKILRIEGRLLIYDLYIYIIYGVV